MCFHTSTTNKVKKLEEHFEVSLSDPSLKDYFDKPTYHHNGCSHPNLLVIPQEKSDTLAPGVWGIVPSNKTKVRKSVSTFFYHDSIMEMRCIIPVSGFFEPHEHKGKKYPFHFKDKANQPLALAGLYTVIETFITFTILTKEASPLFAKVHNKKNRQPIILDIENTHNWLSVDLNKSDIKNVLKYRYPDQKLDTYPVSKDLFSSKMNSDVKTKNKIRRSI